MHEAKNTQRALVRIAYDGRVFKQFLGSKAQERYENEVRVLEYLEKQQCPFVPKLLNQNSKILEIVTTNCGQRVERMSNEKQQQVFSSLEQYGVHHDDAALRNITYSPQRASFCIIDFEFATILEPGYPAPPSMDFDRNLDNL
ncbi:MAG: serine/threonine protein phosphatase [Verrucomicrobiota bacterium]